MVCIGQTVATLVALAGAQFPQQALPIDDEVLSAVSNLTALTWRIERRLATEPMDFATMCQSPCWNDMQKSMIKMLKTMDSPECKALMMPPMCGVTTTTTTTTTTTPSQCTRDRMANSLKWQQGQVAEFEGCKLTVSSVMASMRATTTTQQGQLQEPQMCAMCPMYAQMFSGNMDPCQAAIMNMGRPCGSVVPGMTPGMLRCMKPQIDYTCDIICSAKCKNDKSLMMMLSGGGNGAPATGTAPSTATTTATASTTTTASRCDETNPMSPDAMENQYNSMCAKGPNAAKASTSEGFYCLAKSMELHQGGAFQGATPSDEWPDPCTVDCSTKTSQAIKTLGCCSADMIGMMSQDPKMAKEIKIVKAVAWKCGGIAALTLCDGGSLVAAELLQGKLTVAKCPKTNTEEIAEVRKIANNMDVSAQMVSITICTTAADKGCKARRLGRQLSATNELHYTVKITGANASTVAAKKAAIQAKPMFKKAEAGNLGSVTNPPTTKASNSTDPPTTKASNSTESSQAFQSSNAVKTSAVPSFAGNALVASLVLGVVVPIAK